MNSSDESPVVVELPDDAIEAAIQAVRAAPDDTIFTIADVVAVAVRAAEPVIAARVRAEAVAAERRDIAAKLRANEALINEFARDGSTTGLIAFLIDSLATGSVPVAAGQPHPWFRETPESLALLETERAEVAAVEAAAEQSSGDRAAFDRRAGEEEAQAELLGHRLTVGDVTPGHPTHVGAGYDCCCGECLSLRRPGSAQQPDGWGEGVEAADHPVNCVCAPCVSGRLRDSNDSLRDELGRAAEEIDRLSAGQEAEHG